MSLYHAGRQSVEGEGSWWVATPLEFEGGVQPPPPPDLNIF